MLARVGIEPGVAVGRVGRERVSDMGILRVQWVVRDRWPGMSGRARGVGRDQDGGGVESLKQRGRGRKDW